MSQDDKDVVATEGEDIEAFLKSLEDADVPDVAPEDSPGKGKPVATASDTDDLNARFEELDNLMPDELPAKRDQEPTDEDDGEKKKKTRKERKAEKKAAKARAKQKKKEAKEAAIAATPRWKRAAKKGVALAIMALPMLVFAWILGAFLGNVISAAWLIALLGIVVAAGLPLLVSKLAKRGKMAWWGVGLGVLLIAGLVAPMPKTVGATLTHYGHWPTSVVGELAGWEVDNPLANVGAAVSGLAGSALNSDVKGALKLGTTDRLDGSVMPDTPTDTDPNSADGAESQPEVPEAVPAEPAATE